MITLLNNIPRKNNKPNIYYDIYNDECILVNYNLDGEIESKRVNNVTVLEDALDGRR